jgi:disulfide bond formation protein DsbB
MQKRHRWLYLIFFQAVLALIGSLYYQYAGDPVVNLSHGFLVDALWGFTPCILCRWARILMYPMVWLSAIALRRRDRTIVHYLFPISIAGILLETYHYLLQKTDRISTDTLCTRDAPCNALQVDYFGVITIPFLCLIAFIVIFIACIFVKKSLRKTPELHHTHI